MNDRVAIVHFRRVVAALPSAGDVLPLARLAARLAASCRAELSAVMVEDAMLAQLARLPVARHLSMTSGAALPFTADTARLALAAAVRRTQQQIAGLPELSAVRWSLQAGQDDTTPAIDDEDVVLISLRVALPRGWGHAAQTPRTSVAALVIDEARASRSILLVHDGTADTARALAIAAAIAQPGRTRCRVMVPDALPREAEAAILEPLQRAGIEAGIARAAEGTADSIAAQARAIDAGLVLLPAAAETVLRLQAILAAG